MHNVPISGTFIIFLTGKTRACNDTWQHAVRTTYFTEKQVHTRVCFSRCKSDGHFQFAFLIVFVSWVKNYIYKSRRASNLNFSWLRWLFCFDFHRLIRCIPQGLWLPKAKRYLHQCLRPAAQVGTWKTWDPWKLGPRRLNKWASLVLQVWRTKDIELYIIYSRNV